MALSFVYNEREVGIVVDVMNRLEIIHVGVVEQA
jgi:hypothetical protein